MALQYAILGIILMVSIWYISSDIWNKVYGQTPIVQPTPQYIPPQVQYAPIELKPAGQNDYFAMAMPLILSAGGIFLAKFAKDTHDKVKKVETTTKENSSAIVDSKAVEKEIARLMFEWNKEKAEALDNAPSVKLETLDDNIKKATDTATKA